MSRLYNDPHIADAPRRALTPQERIALYTRAAELLVDSTPGNWDNYACCFALHNASREMFGSALPGKDEAGYMQTVFFTPNNEHQRPGHWMVEEHERVVHDPEVQHRRVMALCFMMALIEAGDDV